MKKFNLLTCILFVCLGLSVYAQESTVSAANKKTAQRCLSLAENYLLKNSYQSALSQAELGLSYDDSISDLYYIKATAQKNLPYLTADVLETVRIGIEKDNWINNNQNNARVLYADLLSNTCNPQASLEVLQMAPVIYSADAEFIRIKDYYRIGTRDSIAQARLKLDTVRRIFPKDERFPYLFFMFETLFMNQAAKEGLEYVIPENVQRIADDYILKLPDYKNKEIDLEIMASMFTTGEAQKRLLKATGEKGQKTPIYALAALKAGVISEEKAFNIFFGEEENQVYSFKLNTLEAFMVLIKDEALKAELKKHLESYNGTIYIDENLDLIDELAVTYERGRASFINFDVNNDGHIEIAAGCDFGVPMYISFHSPSMQLFYDIYPYVSNISEKDGVHYFFNTTDYVYSPFEMIVDSVFETMDVEFYIPYVNDEYTPPERSVMLLNTNLIQAPVEERSGALANYVMVAGKPYSIQFVDENNIKYSWALCQEGFPFVRYVDYDNDNILETTEYYSIDEKKEFQSEEDQQVIKNIFGINLFDQDFYLSQIKIDRNNDGLPEFSEEYLEKGGKVSSWDNDGNGIWDYEFIRYPEENGPLVEETIFYDDKGMEIVSVTDIAGIPSKVKVNKVEQPVIRGVNNDVYWIGSKEALTIEKAIINSVGNKLNIGVVTLVDLKSDGRYSVIKIGQNIFVRRLPPAQSGLNIMTQEINDE